MPTSAPMDPQTQQALDCLDAEGTIRALTDMVDIPSGTGEEAALARWMADRLQTLGFETQLQEISPGRPNALGRLRGAGGGATLLLCGHLDTSYSGREEHLTAPGFKPRAMRDGEWIYGLGANNMKSGLAALLGAAAAIRTAGLALRGDLLFAAVAGEIEKAPVEEFQGPQYEGYGAGVRAMLAGGLKADGCILAEPTGLRLSPGHMGSIWARIVVAGTTMHTAFLGKVRAVHAIEKALKVLEAVRQWIPEYRAQHAFMGERPAVNIAAVRAGWPWRAARTPADCRIYLDVRTLHDQDPEDVRRELEGVLADVRRADPEVQAALDFYLVNPGTLISTEEPVARAVGRAHEAVVGRAPEVAYRGPATDATHLNHHGIPTIVYGPGGRTRGEGALGWSADAGEHVHVQDVVTAARVFTHAILDFCGARAV
jgi:acetylornithine deacetylase